MSIDIFSLEKPRKGCLYQVKKNPVKRKVGEKTRGLSSKAGGFQWALGRYVVHTCEVACYG